jgi:hypothetical protein
MKSLYRIGAVWSLSPLVSVLVCGFLFLPTPVVAQQGTQGQNAGPGFKTNPQIRLGAPFFRVLCERAGASAIK